MGVVTASELRSWHSWRSPTPRSTRSWGLDDVGTRARAHRAAAPRPPAPPSRPGPSRPRCARRCGVDELWSHQVAAIDLARDGRSVAVATGTASGKSLCYQAPIAEAVLDPVRPGTALLHLPHQGPGPGPAAPVHRARAAPARRLHLRRRLQPRGAGPRPQHATVLLTNPEMLHCGLLPHHQRWATFLMRLRYVVVDELHTSARDLRLPRRPRPAPPAAAVRPLRVLAPRSSSPRPPSASPARLASALCGLPVEEVADDGSPRPSGSRALEPAAARRCDRRAGVVGRTTAAWCRARRGGHRCIAFCRSRKGAEMVAAEARACSPATWRRSCGPTAAGTSPPSAGRSRPSCSTAGLRAWSPPPRSSSGSTSAGSTPACSTASPARSPPSGSRPAGPAASSSARSPCSWPATTSSTSTSRRTPTSCSPARRSRRWSTCRTPTCSTPTSPAPPTSSAHPRRRAVVGHADLDDGVRRLVTRRPARGAPGARPPPPARRRCGPTAGSRRTAWAAHRVEPRAAASPSPTAPGRHRRRGRALALVHPGAVYLHQGRLPGRVASTSTTAWRWSSRATATSPPRPARPPTSGARRRAAAGRPGRPAPGHRRGAPAGHRLPAPRPHHRRAARREPLDLPPARLVTRAFWYVIDPALLDERRGRPPVPGTLHAAEHAAIGILPLFAICDRWDVGGVSTVLRRHRRPDDLRLRRLPGRRRHRRARLRRGRPPPRRHPRRARGCPCEAGCPSCVQSPKCGNRNEPLDKAGATALLRHPRAELPSRITAPPAWWRGPSVMSGRSAPRGAPRWAPGR